MAQQELETRKLVSGFLSMLVLAGILALFFQYRHQMIALKAPRIPISLRLLPYYAFCSFYRMLAAYLLALLFSIVYGMLAARGALYERIMIPTIDIAQSVPVIGFFPAAIYFFVSIAHGGRLGVEMAAIFLIFTSQAWNMALGVYESVKTIPNDSYEALEAFGVSGWLRFKRLLMPASVPKLVYNSILSWVAGWYFLIACEIITVGPSDYRLPGLGSFLMQSADKGQTREMIAGLLALLFIIIAMDLLVWQPLSTWAEKFRYEFAATEEPMRSLALGDLVGFAGSRFRGATRILRGPRRALRSVLDWIPRWNLPLGRLAAAGWQKIRLGVGLAALAYTVYLLVLAVVALVRELVRPWPAEVAQIPLALVASTGRLLAAYAISLAWTLPCALAASESPRFNRLLAPMAEIAGSMPATALFPLIVIFVIKVTGGMNLASVLLILTGMQWYLLFNLLAGVRQIPADLKEAARAYGLSRIQTWRKLVIPALIPSLITGSITAWGGGWNALILSEWFVYKGHNYRVVGLGALLDQATYVSGNGVMILLSLMSMVMVVVGLNRLVWRRLYNYATEHYRLDY